MGKEFDWNTPAKVYHLTLCHATPPLGIDSRVKICQNNIKVFYSGTDMSEPLQFLCSHAAKHALNHGDILRTVNYRDTGTFIVIFNPIVGFYNLVKNPDETGTGYLTVPQSVLRHVTDFYYKYEEVIKNTDIVNFRPMSWDLTITRNLGQSVPRTWDFDIHFAKGTLIEFWIRTTECDWQKFEFDTVTLNEITTYFDNDREIYSEFVVHIFFRGSSCEKYINKHDSPSCQVCSWRMAEPKLPPLWFIRKIHTRYKQNQVSWKWVCRGPTKYLDIASAQTLKFLTGFKYKISFTPVGQSYLKKY